MEYPQLIQIETTSVCNAACQFCPHKDIKREAGQMSWGVFAEIIEQCKEAKIERICPFLNGEPFADSLFLERLEYINKELPETKLYVFSNMSLLDEEKLQKLSKIKNIETFFMSLTSYDSDSCKKYMNLDFDTVRKNVMNLINLNKENNFIKQLQASSIDSGDCIENNKFYDCWGVIGIDVYFISEKENWLGNIQSNKRGNQKTICSRANHLCVYWDGSVPLCCFDADAECDFGNIRNKSLLKIFNSSEYKRYRQEMKRDLEPCNRCTV